MKLIKIPENISSQEIKEKIKLFEKQLRQYIRILELIIIVVFLEVLLVLFSFVNIDYLLLVFGLFSIYFVWKIWNKIHEISASLVIYKMLDDLKDKL
jgi:hypothetical protein